MIETQAAAGFGVSFSQKDLEHALAMLGLDVGQMYFAIQQCRRTTGQEPSALIVSGSGFKFCGVPVVFANVDGVGYVPKR